MNGKATINGVEFKNSLEFEKVYNLFAMIDAPCYVIPTKSFVKFVKAYVATCSEKEYLDLCGAFDDTEYDDVIKKMSKVLDKDSNDTPVALMIGEPFEFLDRLWAY